jgi:type IV pilus assembly protein PilV
MKFRTAQKGVTLIEIMVAVLVFAIGLLGLASLQGLTLQSGQSAYYRTQATNIAYEVADFSRVNRSAVINTCSIPAAVLTGWDNFVAAQLPAGTLTIAFPDCAAGQITVTVGWGETRIADAGGAESVVITTRI